MKLIYKILGTGLVAGALLLAGCATEKKSAPDISTASDAELTLYGAAFGDAILALAFDTETPPAGVAIVVSDDLSTVTVTYTNYDDGAGNVLNGELAMKASGSATKAVVQFTANLTISGATNGTVVLSMTSTETASSTTIKGDVTINGNKYSFSVDESAPASVAGSVGATILKLRK